MRIRHLKEFAILFSRRDMRQFLFGAGIVPCRVMKMQNRFERATREVVFGSSANLRADSTVAEYPAQSVSPR